VSAPEIRTSALAAELGVTRQTVANWVTRGLLPTPRRLHLGAHGSSSRFPNYAIALGKYVREALKEAPFGDVAREVAPLFTREPEWIDARLASGMSIPELLRELPRG
jgi:hypothetical protein